MLYEVLNWEDRVGCFRYTEKLGRRSEILKCIIGNLIIKDKQFGLSEQENNCNDLIEWKQRV
ncbi:hypothetical protein QFZ80_006552 [Paenibacillus sp. V4I7]|nr:hypothetical protein [Paenibacillus sp. V4I7]MDQ0918764.1 hypothetical protein [Paenibacillus sp. V4I5]